MSRSWPGPPTALRNPESSQSTREPPAPRRILSGGALGAREALSDPRIGPIPFRLSELTIPRVNPHRIYRVLAVEHISTNWTGRPKTKPTETRPARELAMENRRFVHEITLRPPAGSERMSPAREPSREPAHEEGRMPPQLTTVLAALAIEASPGGYTAVESLLGGSFSAIAEIRCDCFAKLDATRLTGGEIGEWLAALPIEPHAELRAAWVAHRLGARLDLTTLAANIEDLWFPATDNIVSVLDRGGDLLILVLGHEEHITLSNVPPAKANPADPVTGCKTIAHRGL